MFMFVLHRYHSLGGLAVWSISNTIIVYQIIYTLLYFNKSACLFRYVGNDWQ